jgi:hypothetical protein
VKEGSAWGSTLPPVGKAAYESQFLRLVGSVVVDDEDPHTHDVAKAFSVARQWVDAGDYLAAIQAIRGLELTIGKPAPGAAGPTAGEVEQALGDLRRRIASADAVEGTVQAAALWRAAREEVIEGAWESAMALILEGNDWLNGPQ